VAAKNSAIAWDRELAMGAVSVAAVVITFHPDPKSLEQLLNALLPQASRIFIINNGTAADMPWHTSLDNPATTITHLGENKGIGYAQNFGIAQAKAQFADYVLLMDQDSIPAKNMVTILLAAIQSKTDAAAVGPNYIDPRHPKQSPFVRLQGFRLKRVACESENDIVAVDHLIASGCLISMSALEKVGLMREDLFIDYVDIEWGLRARREGLISYGVCAAHMQHQLGEAPVKFLGRNLVLHQAFRHYYLYRNILLLCRESWIPLRWKMALLFNLSLKYFFYSAFTSNRIAHIRMMTRGIIDGLKNRRGKLNDIQPKH
jgi:rhamnosyltransferase